MKISDQKLLDKIAGKDEIAFNEFYKRYASLLYKWVFNRTKDLETSNEVTQDFWSSLWINPILIKTNIDGDAKNFMLHFFTFRILDYLRSQKKNKFLIDLSFQQNRIETTFFYSHILEEIHEKEIHEIIDLVIDTLPDLTKKIFNYRWKENFNTKETALQFNVNEKIVYNRTFIAFVAIRNKLIDLNFDENYLNAKKIKTICFTKFA